MSTIAIVTPILNRTQTLQSSVGKETQIDFEIENRCCHDANSFVLAMMNRRRYLEDSLIGPLLSAIRANTLFLLSMLHDCLLEKSPKITTKMNRVSIFQASLHDPRQVDAEVKVSTFTFGLSSDFAMFKTKTINHSKQSSASFTSYSFADEEHCSWSVEKRDAGCLRQEVDRLDFSTCDWKCLKDEDLLLCTTETSRSDLNDCKEGESLTEVSSDCGSLTVDSEEDASYLSDRHSVYEIFDDVSVLTSESSADEISENDEEERKNEVPLAAEEVKLAFALDEEIARALNPSWNATQDDRLMSFLMDLCEPNNAKLLAK